MEKKIDLRVIKTKKNIQLIFEELLLKKPVEKITVTELADLALINKGTFYHHYNDIYELYQETLERSISDFCTRITFYTDFFTKPENFVSNYLKYSEDNSFQEKFPHFSPDNMRFPFPEKMTDELKKHLYATNMISHSIQNDIRLECAVSNIFMSMFRYGKNYPQELIYVLGENIRLLFPSDLVNLDNS